MKVKSTGLGKTQLQCHFDGFTKKENGEQSVVMVITSTEPVHWHIEADLGGKDLRQMAGQMLKPGTIWHLLKLLVAGSEARGFVMEKEGGRRSSRERVSREPVVRTGGVAEIEAIQVGRRAGGSPDRHVGGGAGRSRDGRAGAYRAAGGEGRQGRERPERARAAAGRTPPPTRRDGETVRDCLT